MLFCAVHFSILEPFFRCSIYSSSSPVCSRCFARGAATGPCVKDLSVACSSWSSRFFLLIFRCRSGFSFCCRSSLAAGLALPVQDLIFRAARCDFRSGFQRCRSPAQPGRPQRLPLGAALFADFSRFPLFSRWSAHLGLVSAGSSVKYSACIFFFAAGCCESCPLPGSRLHRVFDPAAGRALGCCFHFPRKILLAQISAVARRLPCFVGFPGLHGRF
jgi:hypothetical protein